MIGANCRLLESLELAVHPSADVVKVTTGRSRIHLSLDNRREDRARVHRACCRVVETLKQKKKQKKIKPYYII